LTLEEVQAQSPIPIDFSLSIKTIEDGNFIYMGQVNEDGEEHGIGRWIDNYSICEGQWANGQENGWSRDCDGDGRCFTGLWTPDDPSILWKGKAEYEDGRVFEGEAD